MHLLSHLPSQPPSRNSSLPFFLLRSSSSLPQTFLVLRSLYRWLVEGAWSPPPSNLTVAATADASLTPREAPCETTPGRSDPPPPTSPSPQPPVAIRVDPFFLALVTGRTAHPVHQHENVGVDGGSGGGGGGGGGVGVGGDGDDGDGSGGGGGSGGRDISLPPSNEGWLPWVLSSVTWRAAAPLHDAAAAASGGVETTTPATPRSSPLPLPLSPPPPSPSPLTPPPPPPLSPAALSEPRLGGRFQLSGRRCVACCLPVNWPGATVLPAGANGTANTNGAAASAVTKALLTTTKVSDAGGSGGSGGGSISSNSHTGRGYYRRGPSPPLPPNLHLVELYVVLDERFFLLAVPDPESPMDGGIIVSSAPLRNACAKSHPANPRVAELKVSTREDGRAGGGEGPGLFMPSAPIEVASRDKRGGVGGEGGLEEARRRTGAPTHVSYAPAQLLRWLRAAASTVPGQRRRRVKVWQTLPSLVAARWCRLASAPVSYSEASWMGLLDLRKLDVSKGDGRGTGTPVLIFFKSGVVVRRYAGVASPAQPSPARPPGYIKSHT